MSTRADEPAYPSQHHGSDGTPYQPCDGITLREHFAGLAMQGLLAAHGWPDIEAAAKLAVRHADALIAELAKPAPTRKPLDSGILGTSPVDGEIFG